MNTCIAIWNILHDGEITAVAQDGDTLTMFVSIPYLRRRMKPLGDSFKVSLSGVRRCEFRDFDGVTGALLDEMEIGTPQILRTESQSMPVTIETTMGQLILDFEGILLALDTGERLDPSTIERVCEEYWTEWNEKHERRSSV